MRRLIQYPLFYAPAVEISVEKIEIMATLFHRGRMLLLDRVVISNGKAMGEFTVPVENCDGHEPKPGFRVMRGVEMIEMAFQLLGIIIAKNRDSELVELLNGKMFAAAEITGAKFRGFVFPGDKLVLETKSEITVSEAIDIVIIESSKMFARVGDKKKCTIAPITVIAFNQAMLPQ